MRRIKGLFSLLIVTVGLMWICCPTFCIVVKHNGKTLLFITLKEGKEVHYRFRHSVARSYYDEYWRLGEDGNLYLVKVVFRDEGAGLPISIYGKARLELYKDRFEITGIRKKIPNPLFIAVSGNNKESLCIGKRCFEIGSGGSKVYTLSVVRALWLPSVLRVRGVCK